MEEKKIIHNIFLYRSYLSRLFLTRKNIYKITVIFAQLKLILPFHLMAYLQNRSYDCRSASIRKAHTSWIVKKSGAFSKLIPVFSSVTKKRAMGELEIYSGRFEFKSSHFWKHGLRIGKKKEKSLRILMWRGKKGRKKANLHSSG